jgi:putative addiction module component (TIGR02574 family)
MKLAAKENVMNHPPEFAALFQLPVQERMDLAQALWDSVAEDDSEYSLPQWQLDELEARIARHKAGKTTLVSWDEVRQRLNQGK